MTFADLIERAKRRLSAGAPQPHVWPDNEIELAACVSDAIHELSSAVLMDNQRRPWLQQDLTVTLNAAGESTNLLTAVGSLTGQTAEVILEGIMLGAIRDADNNVLVPLMHYADFLRPQSTQFAYYCLKDRVIATRALGVAVNSPADIASVLGPLVVTASFAPKNITDVPLNLEDDLVAHLCEVVLRKTPPVNQ